MNNEFYEKECLSRVKSIAKELDGFAENPKNEPEEWDGEPYDLYSYFADALDIEYRIGGDMKYRGVVITVATGGPHIEVDTREQAVKLWWGRDKAQWSIDSDTAEAIDEIFEENYNSISGAE